MKEKVKEIIDDYSNKSNKDLKTAMDYINEDFEYTKKMVIGLTKHLDSLEKTYNLLLKEYKNRTK